MCFLITAARACPVYVDWHKIWVFKVRCIDGDYFWTVAKTLVWMHFYFFCKTLLQTFHNIGYMNIYYDLYKFSIKHRYYMSWTTTTNERSVLDQLTDSTALRLTLASSPPGPSTHQDLFNHILLCFTHCKVLLQWVVAPCLSPFCLRLLPPWDQVRWLTCELQPAEPWSHSVEATPPWLHRAAFAVSNSTGYFMGSSETDPPTCEVDWMSSSRDMWITYIPIGRETCAL